MSFFNHSRNVSGIFEKELEVFDSPESICFAEPDICPMCKAVISPNPLQGFVYNDPMISFHVEREQKAVIIFFFCPKCQKVFSGQYIVGRHGRGYSSNSHFINLHPFLHSPKEFSELIQTLSPAFVSIYNQSLQAESEGLSDVAGPGYRKSLEFLVKDFAIRGNPTDEESIKAEMLGGVINKYIDNKKIKTLAEKSVWIGNDLTHYEQRHKSLSLEDMKRFVNAMVTFIESELAFEEADKIEKA